MKKLLRFLALLSIMLLLFVLFTNIWVISSTADQIMGMENVPTGNVGLVLGTSRLTVDGSPNRYFTERIQTVASLYKMNKISSILVSGDNRTKYYNEPRDMHSELTKKGIPPDEITMDLAGLRTFDSVVRAKEVFKHSSVIIVTQRFHCYRALFIANKSGLEAFAVSADTTFQISDNLAIREVLARTLAVLDLYVLANDPKKPGKASDTMDSDE